MKPARAATRKPRKPHDVRLAIRVTTIDYNHWRYVAKETGFTLSAMIRHAVELYVNDPPNLPQLDGDMKMSTVIRAHKLFKLPIDTAKLRETTLCDKTIVLRLPRSQLHRWKVAAVRDKRQIIIGHVHAYGRPLSAMIRRAVRIYAHEATALDRLLSELMAERVKAVVAAEEDRWANAEGYENWS